MGVVKKAREKRKFEKEKRLRSWLKRDPQGSQNLVKEKEEKLPLGGRDYMEGTL